VLPKSLPGFGNKDVGRPLLLAADQVTGAIENQTRKGLRAKIEYAKLRGGRAAVAGPCFDPRLALRSAFERVPLGDFESARRVREGVYGN